jgi:hypothetical protein
MVKDVHHEICIKAVFVDRLTINGMNIDTYPMTENPTACAAPS